jgi:Tfp pilus assembly protein PilF
MRMSSIERIKTLQQYLTDDPGDTFSRYALALEYIKQNNDQAAIPLMEHLYLSHPTYIPNYYHYAKLLERLDQKQKAYDIYSHGIEQCKSQGDQHAEKELRMARQAMDEQ